jgi:hypothetical protein
MADEVGRKVVLIRKKTEAPKEELVEPTLVELTAAQERSGPTEKKRARRKRRLEKWQEAHPGLRHVQFVIDIKLWDQFVARCCTTHRPNVVFTRMIREAVDQTFHEQELGKDQEARPADAKTSDRPLSGTGVQGA